MSELLKQIPAVGVLLGSEGGRKLQQEFGAAIASFAIRSAVESIRTQLVLRLLDKVPSPQNIIQSARSEVLRIASAEARRVVNATGIMLHTGLGRSPLCLDAAKVLEALCYYSVLEVELESGERGKRETSIERLLRELTTCEAACVVNNNAAATFVALKAMAEGKEVIVSRGQLIEIGGAFRMPDVMARSGAILREVGTTNRTHISDYEAAISANTGAILHVHLSNYRIHGFTSTPSITELCELGKRHSVPVIDDIGSGALVSIREFGIADEPLVKDSIRAGCELVCFSGDKLISGPQSGIAVGKKSAVERFRKDPFFRMFRPDKILLAALEITLLQYLGDAYKTKIPFYRMLGKSLAELRQSAETILSGLKLPTTVSAEIVAEQSFAGGGTLPDEALPSHAIRLWLNDAEQADIWAEQIASKLRLHTPAIFCRLKDSALLFDMRCLLEGDAEILGNTLSNVIRSAE